LGLLGLDPLEISKLPLAFSKRLGLFNFSVGAFFPARMLLVRGQTFEIRWMSGDPFNRIADCFLPVS